MSAPAETLYQHPDGLGCITWDAQTLTLTLTNETEGTTATALIGPAGLRELAAALLRAGQSYPWVQQ